MVIARRNLMAGKSLPYDAEVEWIEGDGHSWIDTGVDAAVCNTELATIKCRFSISGIGPSGNYNGIWGAAVPRFGVYGITSNLSWGYYVARDNVKSIVYGEWIDSEAVLTKGSQTITLGDETFSESLNFALTSLTIALFCRNVSPNPQWLAYAKISSYSFSSASYAQDMIPVRFTNENGVSEGAMYDRVSGQLFRNAGTGAFVIGPDKVGTELAGGGYKCVRRSWRSSSRRSRSRRFSRWEVAA